MQMIFGDKIQNFPNLIRITEMIGNLPSIKAYE